MTCSNWARPTSRHLTVSPRHTAWAGSQPDLTRNSDNGPRRARALGLCRKFSMRASSSPHPLSRLSTHALGVGEARPPRQNSRSPIDQILLVSTSGKEQGEERERQRERDRETERSRYLFSQILLCCTAAEHSAPSKRQLPPTPATPLAPCPLRPGRGHSARHTVPRGVPRPLPTPRWVTPPWLQKGALERGSDIPGSCRREAKPTPFSLALFAWVSVKENGRMFYARICVNF